MPVIQTADLTPSSLALRRPNEVHQIYNGLDACLTLEVFEEISNLRNQLPSIYNFELALQAPYLEIMNRGFRVDRAAREAEAHKLRQRLEHLQQILNQLAKACWDKGLNPASPKQLQEFFYQTMKLPEVWISQKGQKKLSTNREALEKLDHYIHARPLISCILTMRDLKKQLDVMEIPLDADGRFRSSYNIAGTETGRPSSSSNAFGNGGNAQNIAPGSRRVFVADPGYKICVVDYEQVEARDVGFICGCLFNDWSFLDSCESGDLHTNNAKLIWPERPWTGDPAKDKALAEENFYRDFSYRDMAKRGGHLSNYSGTAWTASRSLKVPLDMMEDFQARYVRGRRGHKKLPDIDPAFSCITKWWQWTAEQLQINHRLTNLFGRERIFFGRPEAAETLREAIAHVPQSTTADRTNLGVWRIWKYEPRAQLLGQTYDSITFQARDDSSFDEVVGRALELMVIELKAPNGRKFVVPGEAKVGWNWGYRAPDGKNPDGLVKWKPGKDTRRRTSGLERGQG